MFKRLRGESVSREDFEGIVHAESFKALPSWTKRKIDGMFKRGLIIEHKNEMYLTDKGFWWVEEKECVLQAMLYGWVLTNGPNSIERFNKEYIHLLHSFVRGPIENRALMILKRLRYRGGIDFTANRLWHTKKIKII